MRFSDIIITIIKCFLRSKQILLKITIVMFSLLFIFYMNSQLCPKNCLFVGYENITTGDI